MKRRFVAVLALTVLLGVAPSAGQLPQRMRRASPPAGVRVGMIEHGRASSSSVPGELLDALWATPEGLRPPSVVVRLDTVFATGEAFETIEAAPAEGELLVEARALPLGQSVWLHELGHLKLGPNRGTSVIERRILRAVHEGLSDYFAAVVQRSPLVASERESRDLRQPPALHPEAWTLVLHRHFDPHPLGWALAATLWQAEQHPGDLLADSVTAVRGYAPTSALGPGAVFRNLVASCPVRTREALRGILMHWSHVSVASP